MLIKNKSGQKSPVLAWDVVNDTPKTGDSANITARYRLDGGTVTVSNDANPTEVDSTYMPGIYEFDALAAEVNGDALIWYAKSATANIRIEPVIIGPRPDVPATFGAVNDAGASTTVFKTTITEATADHYKDAYLYFHSGVNAGQSRAITAYVLDGGLGKFTCTAFLDAPATNDRFEVVGRAV